MKAEQAKNLTSEAIEKLAKALEAGKSDTLRAFLSATAKFHHYSFGNIMLIATQRPNASRVAGFNAWKKLGRFVKKGEKGIVIIAPMPFRRDAEALESSDESRSASIRFKAAYVFDVAQTDGEPLPELSEVTGDPGVHLERLKAIAAGRSITVEYADELGTADGRSKGGRIELRPGMSAAHEFEVLVHELAHETLHHNGDRSPKTVQELEAEAVAFIVCEAVGLGNTAAAVDYIHLYQGSKQTLEGSLGRIQDTAAAILHCLLDSAAVAN